MLYCQNCVYRDHPVMLTTYLPNREPRVKCSGCGYIAADLALVVSRKEYEEHKAADKELKCSKNCS